MIKKGIVSFIFFLIITLCVGIFNTANAFSLFSSQKIIVTATVELSSQQKYLIQKNSKITLQKSTKHNNYSVVNLNINGYQNQPIKKTNILISVFDTQKNIITTIPSLTDEYGNIQINLTRNLSLIQNLEIGFNLLSNDIYSPTGKEFKTISFAQHKANINNEKQIEKIPQITAFTHNDNRVIFVFSTRLKTDMLTRGKYAFFDKQNTGSQIKTITWSARDGPLYRFS